MLAMEEIRIRAEIIDASKKDEADRLWSLLKESSFDDEKTLKKHLSYACSAGKLNMLKLFLMNDEVEYRILMSAQDCACIFSKENEDMIKWLIFEYKIAKSAPLEEILIEMKNKDYAKHIESMFELRDLEGKLKIKTNDIKKIDEKIKKI